MDLDKVLFGAALRWFFRELLHIEHNASRLDVSVREKRCRSYCVGDSKSAFGAMRTFRRLARFPK